VDAEQHLAAAPQDARDLEVGGAERGGGDDEKVVEAFILQEITLVEGEIQRLRAEGLARTNFLVVLTTATSTALFALSGMGNVDQRSVLFASLCLSIFLLALGILSFGYLLGREVSTDYNFRATARLRQYFVERDRSIVDYLSWQYTDEPTKWVTHNSSYVRRVTGLLCSLYFAAAIGLGLEILGTGLAPAVLWVTVAIAFALAEIVCTIGSTKYLRRAALRAVRHQRFPPPHGARLP
jgi:hypothetical protein